MSEVDKADLTEVHTKIGQVHKRIDDMVNCNTRIQVSIAKIETKLESLVIPDPPARPCRSFTEHIEDHKKIRTVWENSAIKTTIDLVKIAIVAAVTYLFARKD